MISRLTFLALFATIPFAFCGCRRDEAPAVSTTEGAAEGAWEYHSRDHGFSLRLPSTHWKQSKKNTHIVDFWCNRVGSPMLAGVSAVEKQTEKEFQESIPRIKAEMGKHRGLLTEPVFEIGNTEAGNPYVFSVVCEQGGDGNRFYYVGSSRTWIEARGLTVTVLFEGQGRMQSNLGQSMEYSEFGKAAKSVCLSIE